MTWVDDVAGALDAAHTDRKDAIDQVGGAPLMDYWLRVPPGTMRAGEAAAWTWGMPECDNRSHNPTPPSDTPEAIVRVAD